MRDSAWPGAAHSFQNSILDRECSGSTLTVAGSSKFWGSSEGTSGVPEAAGGGREHSGKSHYNTAFTSRSGGQTRGVWEMQNHHPGSQADWAILRKEMPSTSPGMNSEIPPTNSPPPPHCTSKKNHLWSALELQTMPSSKRMWISGSNPEGMAVAPSPGGVGCPVCVPTTMTTPGSNKLMHAPTSDLQGLEPETGAA